MNMRVILEPAFVLHTRAYRDTSLLVDLFTLNHGKISVVARNARGIRSRFKGSLIPFAPMLITAFGKTELLQLSSIETNGAAFFLNGNMLFNGLYLNELLVRLLQKFDPFPKLFEAYGATLQSFLGAEHIQANLRRFEMILLTELGYGLSLQQEVNGSKIQSNLNYIYDVNQGFAISNKSVSDHHVFQGEHLLAIAQQKFDTGEILAASRRLMRLAISALLGDYSLKTRELFQ